VSKNNTGSLPLRGILPVITIEHQWEVIGSLSNGDIFNDFDGPLTRFSRSWHF